MTSVASRKAKGRNLQKYVVEAIRSAFNLSDLDVRSTSMGASGEDVLMSEKAKELFPYSIECKNQERLNLWDAWDQCVNNASHNPLLVVKKNRKPVLAIVTFDHFIKLWQR